MALAASGQLKVSEIATEFSDTAPHQLSEFYGAATGIPASGQIALNNFYGAAASAGGGGTFEPIIASTGSNGTTSPNVVNIYYRRTILSFVYTAAELQAALGVTSGTISDLRFYVTNQPAYQPLPNYAIGVKNGTFSGNPGNTGYTIIKSASSESFTTNTYKEFTLATPFQWTGGDLAFTFAWGQVSPSYNASGTARIGSGTMYYSWSDGSGTYVINGDNPTGSQSYRPVLELKLEPAALYEFTSHTFTNAGASGENGPTLAQCTSAYSGASWASNTSFFNVTSGIQEWTVPETATYRFEAKGARGGNGSGGSGGAGATITTDYDLTEGDVIRILVGQAGGSRAGTGSNDSGAGGGGTFVTKFVSPLSSTSTSDVIVVAGGGGGSGSSGGGGPGQTGTSGQSGLSLYSGAGGINGGGGGGARNGTAGNGATPGSNGTSCSYGSGGGGFFSRGGYNCSGGAPLVSGNAFTQGGAGGPADTGRLGVAGGFGGGAGVGHRAPGGGGYSGGGGDGGATGGGGGGSYNGGTLVSSSSGSNTGDGSVTVTKL